MLGAKSFRRSVYLRIIRWRIRLRYLNRGYVLTSIIAISVIGGAALLWRHYGTDASLPVLADSTPILLAIAGIIMSYIQPEKETHWIASVVVVLIGLAGSAVLTIARVRTEKLHAIEIAGLNKKLDKVGDQNTKLGNFLIDKGRNPISESERRRGIEETLRSEYILSHDPIDPQILAGNTLPPAEWMNKRLVELGENEWKFSDQHLGPLPVRSYMAFDGIPVFLGSTTPNTEGGAFKVGDALAFNIHFKAIGPNPVQFIRVAALLILKSTFDREAQGEVIASFSERLRKEEGNPNASRRESPVMPGDKRFITATFNGITTDHLVPMSQLDLDDLNRGAKIAFVISQITYKDNGVIHHQRECLWLQWPLSPPGVWHFCEPSPWESD